MISVLVEKGETMIDITFDEIGEHIDNGDLREWMHGLKTLNAVKGLIPDEEFERMLADMRGEDNESD